MNNIQQVKQLLLQHNGVNDCVIYIQQTQMWVLVELSEQGILVFRDQGRKALIDQLEQSLTSFGIPMKWRFIEKLPQEKIDLNLFIRYFQPLFNPIWTAHSQQESTHFLSGKVPIDLQYFSGHFVHFPLVPGVIELQWVTDQITRLFAFKRSILRIDNLKFQKFLRPNDEIQLILKWEEVKNRIAFQLKTESIESEICASGLIVFGDE